MRSSGVPMAVRKINAVARFAARMSSARLKPEPSGKPDVEQCQIEASALYLQPRIGERGGPGHVETLALQPLDQRQRRRCARLRPPAGAPCHSSAAPGGNASEGLGKVSATRKPASGAVSKLRTPAHALHEHAHQIKPDASAGGLRTLLEQPPEQRWITLEASAIVRVAQHHAHRRAARSRGGSSPVRAAHGAASSRADCAE